MRVADLNFGSWKGSTGKLVASAAAFGLIAFTLLVVGGPFATRLAKRSAIQVLRRDFRADAEIRDFHVSLFPLIRIRGANLALRYEGRLDIPPLISVREFSARAGLFGLFLGRGWKIDRVELHGLVITIPPPSERAEHAGGQVGQVPIRIGEVVSDDAELRIFLKSADRPPNVFQIHRLDMRSVSLDNAAPFTARLTNAKPPGEIDATGQFGPWNSGNPRQTKLAAAYVFKNADLGVFKGIRGTLSSHGSFAGVLERIAIEGETDTPNFALDIGGREVPLHASFNATVDGTNGNTLLHSVRAQFLNSSAVAAGEVARTPEEKGRAIVLNVTTSGRIEDLLLLAVRSGQPFMTGTANSTAKLELPPGEGDVIARLMLDGSFGLKQAEFSSPKAAAKVEDLSRRAEGKPKDKQDADGAISALQGRFQVKNGTVVFQHLTFVIEGAGAQLNGQYALESEKLDFAGTLRMKARLSQTTTGFKSFLLKPFDPFFRKNRVTELPIKITGTREHPSFRLDLHHREEKKQLAAELP